MSRKSAALPAMPPIVAEKLRKLGEDLAVARVRRKESQRVWAQRIGVSIPTLIRMERGEASVSMGVYAMALWMMGSITDLADIAAPERDHGAIERDVRSARKRRAVRSAASIRARLAHKDKDDKDDEDRDEDQQK